MDTTDRTFNRGLSNTGVDSAWAADRAAAQTIADIVTGRQGRRRA